MLAYILSDNKCVDTVTRSMTDNATDRAHSAQQLFAHRNQAKKQTDVGKSVVNADWTLSLLTVHATSCIHTHKLPSLAAHQY